MAMHIQIEETSTGLSIHVEGTSWLEIMRESFYAGEIQIQEIVKSVGLALTQKTLENKREEAEKEAEKRGKGSRKNEASLGHYQSLYGMVSLSRHLYQSGAGGQTWCPLEDACQLKFGSATPLLAELIAFKISSQTPGEMMTDFQKSHRLHLSAHYLNERGQAVGAMVLKQEATSPARAPEVAVASVQVIATGLDGTTMPIVGESYKEAMSGTIALYDAQGERQTTQYLGTMPQAGKTLFKQRFTQQVQQTLQRYPQAQHVCLGDGAKFNWEFLETVFPQATHILDFYHACEHLMALLTAIEAPVDSQEYERWKQVLKEQPEGIHELIAMFRMALTLKLTQSQRKILLRELGYFLNNAHRMRYWWYVMSGFPIGSGVTEAACKELIKARFGRSGMRWKRESGANILQLRAIKLSHQWDHCWQEVMKQVA